VILHDRAAPGRPRSSVLDGLSPREREVAALVAEGLSNKAIARRLGVTIGTVKDHVHRVLAGTGCGSRTAFVARYLAGPPPGPSPGPTGEG
jgi:DNA-binding NarL/FixJ family response regulator